MPSVSRPPVFTIASWVAPLVLSLIMLVVVHFVEAAGRARSEWLPGLMELIVGMVAMALAAFGCGLTALLRRERHRWLAVLPFLAGLGTLLYAGWQRLH
jgi:hypothetical protein